MGATRHPVSTPSTRPQPDAKLIALLGSVPSPLWLADSAGHIAVANNSAEQLFGCSNGELLGKPIALLIKPAASPSNEIVGVRKDLSEFPIEISSRPCETEGGNWQLTAVRDLTEQRNLQKELNEKSAALELLRQEFQAFSHSISHDLRAPLRAMDGFAGMLKRSLGDAVSKESEHSLTRIQENATRMSRLIDGLLDYSTLSWVALTPKKANPAEIAHKSFSGLSLATTDRHIDFSVGDLPACEADPALLRRLFDNLLSNAIKFTRHQKPAVIRVGCRQEKSEQIYFVQDNGTGFDMEYAGKLFHVFQRLHSPSEFEGTGIGLAIAQRIIQRHGGRIWAEAKVDHGATFYFTLGNSGYGHTT